MTLAMLSQDTTRTKRRLWFCWQRRGPRCCLIIECATAGWPTAAKRRARCYTSPSPRQTIRTRYADDLKCCHFTRYLGTSAVQLKQIASTSTTRQNSFGGAQPTVFFAASFIAVLQAGWCSTPACTPVCAPALTWCVLLICFRQISRLNATASFRNK